MDTISVSLLVALWSSAPAITCCGAEAPRPLEYRWREGAVHAYEIDIAAKVNDQLDRYTGDCVFTVGPAWEELGLGVPFGPIERATAAGLDAVEAFDREFQQFDSLDSDTRNRQAKERSAAAADHVSLRYSLDLSRDARSTLSKRRAPTSAVVRERGRLNVDSKGDVTDLEGVFKAPYLGFYVPEVFLEVFKGRREAWSHNRDVVVLRRQSSEAPTILDASLWGRRSGLSPDDKPTINSSTHDAIPCREEWEYELAGESAEGVDVRREYTLNSIGREHRGYLQVTESSRLKFDRGLAVATRARSKRRITLNAKGVTLSIPVLVSIKRVPLSDRFDRDSLVARLFADGERRLQSNQLAQANTTNKEKIESLIAEARDALAEGDRPDRSFSALCRIAPEPSLRDDVLEIAKAVLSDSDQFSAHSALELMGAWGTKRDLPLLTRHATSKNRLVQDPAIEAIGKIGDPSSIPVLTKLIVEYPEEGGRRAARVLEQFGKPAEKHAVKLLGSEDPEVLTVTARLLSAVGGRASVRPLERASAKLGDRTRETFAKIEIESALHRIRSRLADPRRSRGTQRSRSRSSPTVSDRQHQAVEESLASLRSATRDETKTANALRKLARAIPVDSLRKKVLAAIEPHLRRDSGERVRASAASAIGVWGNRRHAPRVARLLEDASELQRPTILIALCRLSDPSTSEVLVDVIADDPEAWNVARRINALSTDSEKSAAALLSSPDVYTRARAALALGRAGGAAAEGRLLGFLESESDSVAYQAAVHGLAVWRIRNGAKVVE